MCFKIAEKPTMSPGYIATLLNLANAISGLVWYARPPGEMLSDSVGVFSSGEIQSRERSVVWQGAFCSR